MLRDNVLDAHSSLILEEIKFRPRVWTSESSVSQVIESPNSRHR